MKKYICPCGYIYDPEKGDPDHDVLPGTEWKDVPEDWLCPVCGIGKEFFRMHKSTIQIEADGSNTVS